MNSNSTGQGANVAILVTPNSVTVQYLGQTHTIDKSDQRYSQIILAAKEKRKHDIPGIIASPIEQIAAKSDGKIEAENGVLRVEIDGVKRAVPTRLASRILEHQQDDLPTEGLIAFAKNLLLNPSYHSVQQLFDFLEKNKHPITDDGRFIAYKKVGRDYMDLHSHKFDNHPGQTPKMPRNEVNEDPEQTCSNGLHVANWDYAKNCYGGPTDPMLEVLVNPKDVVAVPNDYNQAKMRVCEYHVIGEVDLPTTEKYRTVNPPSPRTAPVSAPDDAEDENRSTANSDDEAPDSDNLEEGQLPLKQFCASCGINLKEIENGDEDHEWNCAEDGIGADAIADYTKLKEGFGDATAVNAVADKYGQELAERLPDAEDYLRI